MSFAADVKKELTGRIVSDEAAKPELAALLQMNGVTTLGLKQEVRVQTDNPAIARRIFSLIRQSYPKAEVDYNVKQQFALSEHKVVTVVLHSAVEEILDDLGVDPFGIDQSVPDWLLNTEDKRAAFLRGAFLASGSVNSPDKSNYHLEISTGQEGLAEQLLDLIQDFLMPAKMINRSKHYVIYMKRSDKIVEFMKLIGATATMLHFEDLRLAKDMRNSANRMMNADMANLQKVADAANSQVQTILTIQGEIGDLDELPAKLADFARARLEHPDSSLTEIGDYLEISKSGANHRMRKLKELAKQIEEGTFDADQM
ncbi:DNA-binding protein WhiA [Fructobacillus sp. M1-13]|uniref:Probable cell division protein WhiA n=1 Tax=Fructobacillus papyriferae TaxID=2713171 RepID=A0ABS5QQJ6_9LACO|nr:DNA-binding protein WhiA [Fructobacillus papyriferae]MBS9335385.1 DNA-binding protein WhiA [Fructobacillus papyriferae]MCD2158945.1 DNA-binding protein WhiA [Fructobacillus papyriferae]